ncbi:ABC transporter ATP-binding protein [Rhizobium leguminosarum]|uniref:ATP-binding cassette domain-containing protein n=1 Tax=Rhizobium leguminosarum TaxID=384 RepID=A0A6P0BAE4_RHILE|nr:ABC transporter ATP-binding protein [Rhizobium leguminosarum]MBY5436170.1 ABC transporter ATP-binding protein [Rhizobium leguminosarum]NEI35884.1 ATP-binding cassette domain-containing protein [Rhizobium leguminosarum]NEI42267.1 ATP-binding cassette domain-containing protein [Rhizobium leguminosarum]
MAITSLPITIDTVRKVFGSYVALNDVSLEVAAGEFLTLLGPSGSGKTTLLMALAGFVRPDSGSLTIGGRDVTRLSPEKREIGIVFQNYALFPHMSVLANVAYPLMLRHVSKVEARERAMGALARVELSGYGDRNIAALSGGQRQRVALARAIVFEPRVMLMDEPLSALDKNLREHMQFEIRRLHDDLGITTIYVTHDQREALTMSDRIAVMDAGEIQQIGAPSEIYHHPTNRFVAEFMGEANILPAASLTRMNGSTQAPQGFAMIRAESFHLDAADAEPDAIAITGSLSAKAFRGENWLLNVETEAGALVMLSVPATRAAGCAELKTGQAITAYAAAASVHRLPEGAGR